MEQDGSGQVFVQCPLDLALDAAAHGREQQAQLDLDPHPGIAHFDRAIGTAALLSNTTGFGNTASGVLALFSNTTGNYNTANGTGSLQSNTIGERNTAIGFEALANGTGNGNFGNTATGYAALLENTIGQQNTATGSQALVNNLDGQFNSSDLVDVLASGTYETGADSVWSTVLIGSVFG